MKNHAASIKNSEKHIIHLMRVVEARLNGSLTGKIGKVQVQRVMAKKKSHAQYLPMVKPYDEPYVPSLPLSKRKSMDDKECRLKKCLERVNKVGINKPIVETLKKEPNSPKIIADGVEQSYPPTTAEEKLARKNELKARDLENLSMDDLYNNLKICEIEVKGHQAQAKTHKSTQLDNEDLQHIDVDDLEEIDLKWAPRESRNRKPVNDKYKIGKGYHAVPPPYTRNFMPPKPDLILADVDEYVVSESVTSVPVVAKNEAEKNETIHEERGDRVERAATTASSLEAKELVQVVVPGAKIPYWVTDLLKLDRVLALKNTRTAQDLEITHLKKRVKRLEKKRNSRTSQLKRRLFKVRIESFVEKSLGRYGHATEINTASTSITTASINITTAEPVTTASAPITTAGVSTLMKLRSGKSKEKAKERGSKEKSREAATRPTRGVIMREASETTTRPIVPPQQKVDPKYKGKGKMVEPEKPLKRKDQIVFDKEGRYGHATEINTASTSITTASINITTAEPVTTVSAPITTTGVSVSIAEPKMKMKIVSDDEVAIDAIPLATKPSIIVDWKIIKEGKINSYHIIRVDGSSKRIKRLFSAVEVTAASYEVTTVGYGFYCWNNNEENKINGLTFDEWLSLRSEEEDIDYLWPYKKRRPQESDDYDMKPPDKPFEPTPFVNARKQRVLEVFKESLKRRDICESLDLDEDDVELMEDFVEQNPNDGFVDKEVKELHKRSCKLLGLPYSEPVFTRYKVCLNGRYTSVELLESMQSNRKEENICEMRAKIIKEMDESGLVQGVT
nr:hypothetical protein [Tanacetum cinerariifolium]